MNAQCRDRHQHPQRDLTGSIAGLSISSTSEHVLCIWLWQSILAFFPLLPTDACLLRVLGTRRLSTTLIDKDFNDDFTSDFVASWLEERLIQAGTYCGKFSTIDIPPRTTVQPLFMTMGWHCPTPHWIQASLEPIV